MAAAPKITTELTRFVTVRNPEPVSSSTSTTTFTTTALTAFAPTAYVSSLASIRAQALAPAAIRAALSTAANNFSEKAGFLKSSAR